MRKKRSISDAASGDLRRQIFTFAFPIFHRKSVSAVLQHCRFFHCQKLCRRRSIGGCILCSADLDPGEFFQGFSSRCRDQLTARNIRKHDEEEVQKSVHTSAAMGLGDRLISILGVLISEPIAKLMNTPSDILNDAVTYLSILLWNRRSDHMQHVRERCRHQETWNPAHYQVIGSLPDIVLDNVFIRNSISALPGSVRRPDSRSSVRCRQWQT